MHFTPPSHHLHTASRGNDGTTGKHIDRRHSITYHGTTISHYSGFFFVRSIQGQHNRAPNAIRHGHRQKGDSAADTTALHRAPHSVLLKAASQTPALGSMDEELVPCHLATNRGGAVTPPRPPTQLESEEVITANPPRIRAYSYYNEVIYKHWVR